MKKGYRKAGTIVVSLLFSIIIISCGDASLEQLPAGAGYTAKQDEPTEAEESSSEETKEAAGETETAKEETAGETVSQPESKKASGKIEYPDKAYADDIDAKISASSAYNYTKTRANDKKSGDIVDTSIYRDKSGIVKIVTEDHGSEGRLVSEYYYDGNNIVYIKRYKTDIYGINSSFTEADLSDPDSEYAKEAKGDADEVLKEAKKDTGKALLYGYAGDEQGGVLKNVTVKLRNVAGDYTGETVTDGDGYFTFQVPQKEDTYSASYLYDNCPPTSVNDIHIVPGTPEYSLGRNFLAEEGKAIHETDSYLLNAKKKSPVTLKDGEYAAVLTSDNDKMNMRLVNTDDQKDESGKQIKFNPSNSVKGYALFVEDEEYLSKEDMAGTIGRTYMTVTIYDRNGIIAAFREPSGRLGTLWKVCTIDDKGGIAISGIMYTDSKGWILSE